MTDFTGLDQLRSDLESHGFKIEIDVFRSHYNACNWYAYRRVSVSARKCEANPDNPVPLIVKPFIRDDYESSEVELTGEANGRWHKLLCYSLKPDQLIAQLPEIEAELVAAWNALSK